MPSRRATLLLALALSAGCASSLDYVVVRDVFGAVTLRVALVGQALSATERAAGLRDYAPLAEDEGLLLRFPLEDEICIVNAGVDYPIDAVFLLENSGGTYRVNSVVSLAAEEIEAHCAVASAVLEVRQGTAASVNAGQTTSLPAL